MLERFLAHLSDSGAPVAQCPAEIGPHLTPADFTLYASAGPNGTTALAAALASFDWSEQAQAMWELQRRLMAAGDQLVSLDALPIAVRVVVRVIGDRVNAFARSIGAEPPLLEADVMADVAAGLAAGIGLPTRPDL